MKKHLNVAAVAAAVGLAQTVRSGSAGRRRTDAAHVACRGRCTARSTGQPCGGGDERVDASRGYKRQHSASAWQYFGPDRRRARRDDIASGPRADSPMIGPPANTRIWIAAGVTDMRCGFNSLAAKVQTVLEKDSFGGHVFIFRGRRSDLLKALYWSDGGLCLFAKRLEKGRFAWPRADAGVVALTTAQLSLLLEGFDWRQPVCPHEVEHSS